MIDTFYMHLEFSSKNPWSINLPFLCTKCGNCCKLEDFLSAGKINAKTEEYTEAHDKISKLFEELGKLWEADEVKYEEHIMHNPCPFLVNKSCSIYEIRPDGCRLFPKTAFGMQSGDCEPLIRFKKMRIALKKGRNSAETYHYFHADQKTATHKKKIKSTKFTQKQYQTCIDKLSQAGATADELTLFNYFNCGQRN